MQIILISSKLENTLGFDDYVMNEGIYCLYIDDYYIEASYSDAEKLNLKPVIEYIIDSIVKR